MTCPLGQFHLLSVAQHADHLMQRVLRPPLGDTLVQRLQAGAHARYRAVVVRPLLVDNASEAAAPLIEVVGHVGDKIRIAAVAFTHHAVFVIAVSGGAQPQGAALFVGGAVVDKALDARLDLARGVQRGLQKVHVETDTETL